MTAYLIKSSVSLLLMFGLYWFLLRKEKLFVFNRIFLIFSIVFSLALPFISIPISIQNSEPQGSMLTTLNRAMPGYSSEQNTFNITAYQSFGETEPVPVSERINYSQILILLYITGVLLFLVRFLRNIFFIYRQKRMSEKITYSGQILVLADNQINPFCFFNTIFVSKRDYLNNTITEELLLHEIEHIRQSHSVDVIFIELIKIIYWFNPILILYSRAIRVNHEYLADNGVIRGSSNIKDYADKLINFISCKRNIPLTSGFNPSLTKKRLIMLTKSKSRIINYGARIFVTINLSAALFLMLSFSPSYSQPLKEAIKQQQEAGVSQELLKEYHDLLNKYKRPTKDGREGYFLTLNPQDKERLETIFFQMSKEQQAKQMFVFVPKSSIILPKSTPTVKQFESFKDPKMYGVWIEDKKVNNSELNKYKNTDFAYMSESILLKNAKDYGKYVYQVNLMTNQGYQTYYNKAISEKGNVLVPNKLNLMPQHEVRGKQTNTESGKAESSAIINQTKNTPEKIVKGFVVNKFGKYLHGVTISVTGKNKGIITDAMGRFEISNVSEDDSLTFTCKEYINQTLRPVFSYEMLVKLAVDHEVNDSVSGKNIFPVRGSIPLMVIDGAVVDGITMAEIDPTKVISLNALKDKIATDKYGEKGKNGVIEITSTRKPVENKPELSPASYSKESRAKTLVIVDGTVYRGELNDIPATSIEQLSVKSYTNAYDKYGEKEKEKVIEITTKKATDKNRK
jgi:bla regulator protein blaR1